VKWALLIAILGGMSGLGLWLLSRSRRRRNRARSASMRARLQTQEDAMPSLADLRMANFTARAQSEAKTRSAKAVKGLLDELEQNSASEGMRR